MQIWSQHKPPASLRGNQSLGVVHHLSEQIFYLSLNSVGQRFDLGLDGRRQRLEILLNVFS